MESPSSANSPAVRVERMDGIAWLTLNRPERRNALGEEMLLALIAALSELRDDGETRVVVLTGAAPVFCAGAQAKVKSGSSDEDRRNAFVGAKTHFRRLFERATNLLENLEQITVAAVNGHAIGAGWGLALACDFRIAARNANFWIPEVELGVLLGVGSTTRLIRAAGSQRAKEIVLEGRRYPADELLALGMVTRVVEAESLIEESRTFAASLAAKPFSPLAQMKARINAITRNAVPEVSVATDHFLPR